MLNTLVDWTGSRAFAFLFTLAFVVRSSSTDMGRKREYCEAETFRAQCPLGGVVVMRHAQYGRMVLGRCVILDYGYVGCEADVMPHLDTICSGRHSCEVRIPDASLDRANPCPKDLKTYLLASYDCVTARFSQCSTDCHNFTLVRGDSGYLSSYVTKEESAACATGRRCPWRIRVAPGQTINVTLLDFGIGETGPKTTSSFDPYKGKSNCRRYAVVTEPSSKKTTLICGDTERTKQVYASVSNVVDIHPRDGATGRHRIFLLKYQAVGCADFPRPPNARMERKGDRLVINCLATKRSYQLECLERKWIGTMRACPTYLHNVNSEELKATGIGVPLGLMVAIVAAIALVTGTCIVMAGLVVLKRRRLARAHAHIVADASYSASCQQRSILHEQQYSGSSAKSTPNEYDYSMEMRPLPSVPASEKDLSKMQCGTSATDELLPLHRAVTGKLALVSREESDPRSSNIVTYFELDVEKAPPGHARRYEKMRERRDGDTDPAATGADV